MWHFFVCHDSVLLKLGEIQDICPTVDDERYQVMLVVDEGSNIVEQYLLISID